MDMFQQTSETAHFGQHGEVGVGRDADTKQAVTGE
jgi:hypothetical protein